MDTKEKIIFTGLDLFIRNGYERTSLSEIADRIGITKPAIYYHFKNKDDLFMAIMEGFLVQFETMMYTFVVDQPSVKATLQVFFNTLSDVKGTMSALTGHEDEGGLEFHYYHLMFEGINKFPEIGQRIETLYARSTAMVTEKIKLAQRQGEIQAGLNPEALAFQIFATVEGAFLINIFNPKIDMAAISQAMFENTWQGIRI